MGIGRIDLNLIKIFNAVFEDRNLLRAGKRLNISPSAVSHALSRLREVVGDELFIRTAHGMGPTARATAMAHDLRASVHTIMSTLGVEPFDAMTSTRCFVIAANDHLTAVISQKLSVSMMAESPFMDIVIRPSTRLDLAEQIDLGRIDLALGRFAQVPSRFASRTLLVDEDVILMRKGHPASRRKLNLDDLAHYPLITVSVGGQEEGAVDGFILERGLARQSENFDRRALEEALSSIGATPRYRMTMSHSFAIPNLLHNTDMLSVMPSSLAGEMVSGGSFVTRPTPYAVQPSTYSAVWHGRNDHDPAQAWLRGCVVKASSSPGEAKRNPGRS
ncbi:MAG: LysR substrate-binding domain-containing protein [Pseudolabrys sp.]|nr:LysR substrate-binding domain-containing protein [Pseudolabrys sp.]